MASQAVQVLPVTATQDETQAADESTDGKQQCPETECVMPTQGVDLQEPVAKWRRITGKKEPGAGWVQTLSKQQLDEREALLERLAFHEAGAPAAAKSAYNIFSAEARQKASHAGVKQPPNEMSKLVAKEWAELSPEQKSHYATAAANDKTRASNELKLFKQTDTFRSLQVAVDRFLRMNSARHLFGEQEMSLKEWLKHRATETAHRAAAAKSQKRPRDNEQRDCDALVARMMRSAAVSSTSADAAAPRPAHSAYSIFLAEVKGEEMAKGGNIVEAVRMIAARWSSLGATAKAAYVEQAARDKERYEQELDAFRGTGTYKELSERAGEFQSENKRRSEAGEPPRKLQEWMHSRRKELHQKAQAARKKNKLLDSLLRRAPRSSSLRAAPKRPPDAYTLFATAKRPEAAAEGGSLADVSKRLASMWRDASPQDKATFTKEADDKKVHYGSDLKAFQLTDEYKAFVAAFDEWQHEGKAGGSFWAWHGKRSKLRLAQQRKHARDRAKIDRAAARAAAQAQARAARLAAKSKPKAASTQAADAKMHPQPLDEDPFWDSVGKTATLDQDDRVLNDRLVVACAKQGGPAAKELLDSVGVRAERATSLFRPQSADCQETSLHYALLRGDVEMLRVLAREQERRGGKAAPVLPKPMGLAGASEPAVAKGTTLWHCPQQGAGTSVLKGRSGPAADAPEESYSITEGEAMKVEECRGEWIKTTGGVWLPLQWNGVAQFVTEDPESRRPRPQAQRPELQPVSTGCASGRAYRAKKLRRVKLSRGGREGNQAFVRDLVGSFLQPAPPLEKALHWAAERGVGLASLTACCELFSRSGSSLDPATLLGSSVRFGRVGLARELVEKYGGTDFWGLNALHKLALKEGVSEEEIAEAGKRKQSVLKKAQENYEVSPLHCACIGPEPRLLEAMLGPLGTSAEDQSRDTEQRTLLHYAAASETTGALELLLERRFSPHRTAIDGITPLMCAAMANRPDCMRRLIATGADPLVRSLSEERTAFHWAVQYGAKEALAALLEHRVTVKGKSVPSWDLAMTSSKRSALHFACARGDEAMVEMFLTLTPRSLHKPDKQGHTPLIFAVMNGHTKLASKLLSRGAVVNQADTSGNAPLHYALAYGWRDAARLLVDWGHEPDVQNTWRNTPVDVAILKAHYGAAAWFAANHPINPDVKDEKGRTLLSRACTSLGDRQWRALLSALVEGRGADVNLAEGGGSLPICIAVQQCAQKSTLHAEVEAALRSLCAAKADVSRRAGQGPMKDQSALSIALRGCNHGLLCLMLQSGAGVAVHGNGETLLHTISDRVITSGDELPGSASVLAAIREAVPREVLQQMAQTPDCRGLLPMHAAVMRFNSVMVEVRCQWERHKQREDQRRQQEQLGRVAPPNTVRVKSEEAVLQSFRSVVLWLRAEAGAELDAQVAQLAEPWKELPSNLRGALGPLPHTAEAVVERSVPAHEKELWQKYDAVLGLATPLMMLVAGGSSLAVEWLLGELRAADMLEHSLSTANLYGVTPLVVALHQAAGALGLLPHVILNLVVSKAINIRSFDGRTPLHLAAAGGSRGWGAEAVVLPKCPAATPAEPAMVAASEGTNQSKAETWRDKIVSIWKVHSPEKVAAADSILAKYTGRELSAYLKVCQKYGVKPDIARSSALAQGGTAAALGTGAGGPGTLAAGPGSASGSPKTQAVDARPDMFEAVLDAAVKSGVVDVADCKGWTPLHIAVQEGLRELPEPERLSGCSRGFAEAVRVSQEARRAAALNQEGASRTDDVLALEPGVPFGLKHSRVSCGCWYFELRKVDLQGGRVGFADARAMNADNTPSGIGLHWALAESTWPSGCTIGVALDADQCEVWISVNGRWENGPALRAFRFEKYLFPVVSGKGHCTFHMECPPCRLHPGTSLFRGFTDVAPSIASSQRMVVALLAARADANAVTGDSQGVTALHLAAMAGDAAVVHRLCDFGSAVDVFKKHSTCTPLHISMHEITPGKVAVATALVVARANVSTPTPLSGKGHLQQHMYAQQCQYLRLPLHTAVEEGPAVLVGLLVKARADTNAPIESRKVFRRRLWLPLPSTSEEPSVPGSQEDRGLRVGGDVALRAETAMHALRPLGVDLVHLAKIVSKAVSESTASGGHGVAVLRGKVARMVGDSCYELGGGDFAPLLAGALPLLVSRETLLVSMEVDSVKKAVCRPLHRAAERNEGDAVRALLLGRAEPSEPDGRDGRLALHHAVSHRNSLAIESLVAASSALDTEDATKQKARPLLSAVQSALAGHGLGVLETLLKARAAMDKPCAVDGLAPLHLAAAARSVPVIDLLLLHRADPSVTDPAGRSPLHKAVNAAAPSEPSFFVERKLLSAGAPVNALDKRRRSALHYAFVKEGKPWDASLADPVETVTSLCAIEGVLVDVADEFGATPLLYAARRGGTISSLYLAKRGVSLQVRDVHGNDVLGTALAAGHHEYAITLLSQNAGDVNAPMRHVRPREKRAGSAPAEGGAPEASHHCWRKFAGISVDNDVAALPSNTSATVDLLLLGSYSAEWTFELMAGPGAARLGLAAMPPAGERLGASHRTGWICISADSGAFWIDGCQSAVHMGLQLRQHDKMTFYLDMAAGNLSCQKNLDDKVAIVANRPDLFAGRMWRPAVQGAPGQSMQVRLCGCRLLPTAGGAAVDASDSMQVDDNSVQVDPPVTLFYEAIKNKSLGLAYLLLDNGFPFHKAIQDSLSLGEFRLVLTLLSKINPAQNKLVRGLDAEGRNLLHVLADFPHKLGPDADEISAELAQRGVQPGLADGRGRLPLHCAVANGHFSLSSWLLSVCGMHACSERNALGQAPLQGACTRSWLQKHGQGQHLQFLGLLLPGDRKAVAESFQDDTLDLRGLPDIKPPVRSVPLVNVVSLGFAESAARILDAQADCNVRDGLSETPLGAVLRDSHTNTVQLVQLLLFNAADPNMRDSRGNTPLRCAVRSRHSVKLVEDLVKAGAQVTTDPGTKPPRGSLVLDALKVPVTSLEPPEVLKTLLDLKASPSQGVDVQGCSPILVAVDTERMLVFEMLLAARASPTCTDAFGRSALSAAIAKRQPSMVSALLAAKADAQVGNDAGGRLPLFMAVEWGNELVVNALLTARADANKAGKDDASRAPLSIAVRSNFGAVSMSLLEALADPKAQDKQGRNAAHHCIQPLAYGSYENAELLHAILRAPGGRETITVPDVEGITPSQLATTQGSGRLLAVLVREGLCATPSRPASLSSRSMAEEPTAPLPDIEGHALAELERIDASAQPMPIPVHSAYGMAGENRVFEQGGVEHDALLFKVDLKRNEMRFYHLQLVREVNKELYVLFTRWGEIGETGMYQRTPQPSLEEALKEFGKLFREKTGNVWATKDTDFERKPNKYQILRRRRAVARNDQLLRPFEAELGQCKLPPGLQRTVRAMCDPQMVGKALASLGIKTQSMPFGSLTRATLGEARELLGAIRLANEELRVLRPAASQGDPSEFGRQRNEIRERILELSSRYYELVPRKAGAGEVARPLEGEAELAKEFEALTDLTEASVGVQLLLGALHCQAQEHPFDYCLRGLGISLEAVDPASEEFSLLLRYAQSTCTSGPPPKAAEPHDFIQVVQSAPGTAAPQRREQRSRGAPRPHDTITAIYRLARRGEGARFEDGGAAGLGNRRLLWHGSRLANVIGIMTQGLRVAPPEAPSTGYMFGKGVYFADVYSKSRQYCRSSNTSEPAYMVLCEVALGDMYPCKEALYMDSPQPGTHSTWGQGRRVPDWANQVVEPGGAALPKATLQDVVKGDALQQYRLNFNEFIVYDPAQIHMRYLIELNNFECHVEDAEDTRAAKRAKLAC